MRTQRITVTVEDGLADVVRQAVARGEGQSVSGWVNEALREKVERDRRLSALAAAVAAYEAEVGAIGEDEIAAQARADRDAAARTRRQA